MLKKIPAILVVLFWIVTTGWLVRTEIAPRTMGPTTLDYERLFSGGLLVMDHWMKILFQDRRVGYSHTSVDVNEDDPLDNYGVNNDTVMTLNIMGEDERVRTSTRASLDSFYHLRSFHFRLSCRSYSLDVEGNRIEGEDFAVVIRTDASVERTRVTIPDDTVIYSPMTEMTLRTLKPGKEVRIRTFNPVSMTSGNTLIKALRREELSHAGRLVKTTVLSAEYEGMEMLAWIDEEGRILRQQTPLGWTLVACEAREALQNNRAVPLDMLTAMSVPCSRLIPNPRTTSGLRLRLGGIDPAHHELGSHRQSVTATTDDSVDLLVKKETLPNHGAGPDPAPGDLDEYLRPTTFVQARDPAIVKRAAAIVGTRTNALEAGLAIHDWVHAHMQRKPTVSVPSAADILRRMEGDCNEHTYLYVALARAAGIPAKIVVGLTYNDGAFYYHAWPAIYAGRWVELDPTLGQKGVDATHVRLLEGEISDQLKLMGLIGRLHVDVLPHPVEKGTSP